MLLNLNITDLAVVKALDLELHKGMSVLTGETGAGKSILLTALGLALGDRADSGYIRPGSKRAEINLEFDLNDAPEAYQWLQENELDNEQQCFIRRVVSDDGRSKAYINNRPVTLQSLQELAEKLVEIHGQHAHLSLLQADEQRRLLDVYGKHQALLDELNTCFRQWQKTNQELQQLLKASSDQTEREQLLNFQLEELKQLDLAQFNYAALLEEHSKLANLGQILSVGQAQVDALYENDQQSANKLLHQSIQALNPLSRFAPELNEVCELLSEAQIQTQEAALQLRRFLKVQEADPRRLDWLESQMDSIQKLSRKHKVQPEELPTVATQLEQQLYNISHSGERISELTKQTEQLRQHYDALAQKLSLKRQQHAEKLQQQITAVIKELGMPQGDFQVAVTEVEDRTPKLNGLDMILFLVSANPGLPAKSLAKVASGGELSRISLAIQVTTAHDKSIPTMIFDEVDSGIGGGTAEIVGQKLRQLGCNRQVLCVTHLPQVAAQAHQHLFVSKNQQTDITTSQVTLLDEGQRVEEIARMLGGVNITANTLAHAREMLNHTSL